MTFTADEATAIVRAFADAEARAYDATAIVAFAMEALPHHGVTIEHTSRIWELTRDLAAWNDDFMAELAELLDAHGLELDGDGDNTAVALDRIRDALAAAHEAGKATRPTALDITDVDLAAISDAMELADGSPRMLTLLLKDRGFNITRTLPATSTGRWGKHTPVRVNGDGLPVARVVDWDLGRIAVIHGDDPNSPRTWHDVTDLILADDAPLWEEEAVRLIDGDPTNPGTVVAVTPPGIYVRWSSDPGVPRVGPYPPEQLERHL